MNQISVVITGPDGVPHTVQSDHDGIAMLIEALIQLGRCHRITNGARMKQASDRYGCRRPEGFTDDQWTAYQAGYHAALNERAVGISTGPENEAVALLKAVTASEFGGIKVSDVNGRNWFDARDELVSGFSATQEPVNIEGQP